MTPQELYEKFTEEIANLLYFILVGIIVGVGFGVIFWIIFHSYAVGISVLTLTTSIVFTFNLLSFLDKINKLQP